MDWKYEKEFREKHPETIGETDKEYDLDNYKDFLEGLIEQANGIKPLLDDVRALLERIVEGEYRIFHSDSMDENTSLEADIKVMHKRVSEHVI